MRIGPSLHPAMVTAMAFVGVMAIVSVIAILGLAAVSGASAEELVVPDVQYPALPASVARKEAFVPAGWKLELQASGDLNGDGVADVALVLHQTDPKNILANKDGLGEKPFDTNPRILAVGFGRSGGGYDLALENHTLIGRRTEPTVDDPLDGRAIAIGRGSLRVTLSFFASAGGWTTSKTTYTFRYRDGGFGLIGYDDDATERNSGITTLTSVNYLTRKKIVTKGSIENDAKTQQRSTIPDKALLSLASIGDGLEFEPQD